MNSTLTMNDLPPEMICHVLNYLSLAELVDKKLVCKLWNELISSQLKVTGLFVTQITKMKKIWWHVNRPIDEHLEVHPYLFLSQLHLPILRNLKCLRIYVYDKLGDFNLNELNAFDQLVHLDVFSIVVRSSKIEWNLPNLQTLKVALRTEERENQLLVSIDCPRLKVLSHDYPNMGDNVLVDVKAPETIITLCAAFHGAELTPFKNIEIYKYLGELASVNLNSFIEQMPKLKVLEMNNEIERYEYELRNEERRGRNEEEDDEEEEEDEEEESPPQELFERFLKRLLADRRKALRSDLKLFFAGVEIRDEALVDHLDFQMIERDEAPYPELSNEHLYFGNYPADCLPNLQERLEFIDRVHYNVLMSLVDELPKDYFKRFSNIDGVITSGKIQDPEHFASFLKSLNCLCFLRMLNPCLEQEWYDRLPAICYVRNLYLNENDETVELNFDFLARFEPHIQMASVNKKFRLNSASSLPNLLKSFRIWFSRKFRLNFKGVEATIRLRRVHSEDSEQSDDSAMSYVELDGFYDVLVNNKLKLERANSMEVVDFFEELEKELNE